MNKEVQRVINRMYNILIIGSKIMLLHQILFLVRTIIKRDIFRAWVTYFSEYRRRKSVMDSPKINDSGNAHGSVAHCGGSLNSVIQLPRPYMSAIGRGWDSASKTGIHLHMWGQSGPSVSPAGAQDGLTRDGLRLPSPSTGCTDIYKAGYIFPLKLNSARGRLVEQALIMTWQWRPVATAVDERSPLSPTISDFLVSVYLTYLSPREEIKFKDRHGGRLALGLG